MIKTPHAYPLLLAAALLPASGCERQAEAPRQADVRFSDTSSGEHHKDVGNYVIHFNAFPTEQLAADVARTYGIVRSKSRIMLNVTVLQKEPGGTGTPVTATLNVRTTNLAGQLKNLPMRELREQDAIYYVGDTSVSNGETLVFDIEVTPENETSAHGVKFRRQFFY